MAVTMMDRLPENFYTILVADRGYENYKSIKNCVNVHSTMFKNCARLSDTTHVETVVLLFKGEIDTKKVRVEFSLEDMDMSGFQKGRDLWSNQGVCTLRILV